MKVSNSQTGISIKADNRGNHSLEMWGSFVMVQQPAGTQHQREPFDSGDFPYSPDQPIPESTSVTGLIIFDTKLSASTTSLVISIKLKYDSELGMPSSLRFGAVALTPAS